MAAIQPALRTELRAFAIGDLLRRSNASIDIDPEVKYKQVTVRLWGQGVILRDEVFGSEIAASRRIVVSPGQLILSKIDARSGAMGIVPAVLDGAVVSGDFPVYDINSELVLPEFLEILCKTGRLTDVCKAASEGTTNRIRLREDRFLLTPISLPDPTVQQLAVTAMSQLTAKLAETAVLSAGVRSDLHAALAHAYTKITTNARREKIRKVAPIIRRAVSIDAEFDYPELGIRSFGKGTFHKPAVNGAALGTKRLFQIAQGDLIFNNVFAWEGAIAVAQPSDSGRYGSHRFITCLPTEEITADFLRFHFLTYDGLEDIRKASPGGAGRNRTLGVEALQEIEVPVPSKADQKWFNELQRLVAEVQAQQESAEQAILEVTNAFVYRLLDSKPELPEK